MVVIKRKSDKRKAFWVDGYIPPLDRLRGLEKPLGLITDTGRERLGDNVDYAKCLECGNLDTHTKDEIRKNYFTQLVYRYMNEYCRDMGKEDWEICGCNAFLLKFVEPQLPFRSPFYELIAELLGETLSDDFYSLVFVPNDICEDTEECLKNIIQSSGLKETKPKDYGNFPILKMFYKAILDDIIKCYEYPFEIAADRLSKIGYTVDL
jgi:hypothetical protein